MHRIYRYLLTNIPEMINVYNRQKEIMMNASLQKIASRSLKSGRISDPVISAPLFISMVFYMLRNTASIITFEPYVAKPLAEFVKSQTARERIWIAEQVGKIAGSIAIVKSSDDEAQLRWLLLHPDARGFGNWQGSD